MEIKYEAAITWDILHDVSLNIVYKDKYEVLQNYTSFEIALDNLSLYFGRV